MRAAGGKAEAVADLAGIGSLRGSHNAQNAACAVAACVALGVDLPAIQKGLASFPGLRTACSRLVARGACCSSMTRSDECRFSGQGAGEF
jgi:UDP-N-acetylmuramoylalanine--D-glutamate ligase